MHYWGDGFEYFEDVGDAAEFIGNICRKYGRIGVTCAKEKYGTSRVYCSMGGYNLLSVTHPGYMHYGPYPNWLSSFDIWYGPKLLKFTGTSWILSIWQPIVYSLAYKAALKKYPHIQAEILSCADWPELIKGHTRRDGNKLEILDLNGKVVSTWTS